MNAESNLKWVQTLSYVSKNLKFRQEIYLEIPKKEKLAKFFQLEEVGEPSKIQHFH